MEKIEEKQIIEILRQFAEQFDTMTCIMSVDAYPSGGYGNIRIVTGNQQYLDSVEKFQALGMPALKKITFIPNQPYETYIPQDLNFEDFCYHAAILKKPMHSYAHPERFDFWFDMYAMPIHLVNGITHYCTYSQILTPNAESTKMTDHSQDITASVLNTCIKLRSTTDFRQTLNEIIHDIRLLCNAQSCCLLTLNQQDEGCTMLAKDFDDQMKDKGANLQSPEEFYIIARSWKDTIAGSSCLIIKNEYDMQTLQYRNPAWHASLVENQITSLILFPLKHNNETIGYIWASNYDTDNATRIKETLELTTFFLASELANYQMVQQLQIMSTMDLLTGVFNRNAMNTRVDSICQSACGRHSIGVVFADLNGLKQVNDNEGHVAGDQMLKKAAEILKKHFPDNEIYRAGGDEFMIIAIGLSERELARRVQKLHDVTELPEGVSFAVGSYHDETSGDIRRAMRAADERMYEDKQRYYALYPDRKVR